MRRSLWSGVILLMLANHCPAADISFTTDAYPPYVINHDGEATGIFPAIIHAVFRDSSDRVIIRFRPWLRAEQVVRRGRAFATFPYVPTPTRAAHFNFSNPVINFFPRFFYRRAAFPKGFHWQRLSDFRHYRVGGVLGYWYQPLFERAGVRVDYVRNDRLNLEKLYHDRIDFTLIDALVGWTLIRQTFPGHSSAFAAAPKPQTMGRFRLMVSRKYPDAKALTARFNRGLAHIKQDGTYRQILRRYKVPQAYAVP